MTGTASVLVRVLQISGLVLLWLAGDALARITGLALPGSIIGLGLLLLLLATRILPLEYVAPGADWLLARMLVLFVPAVLAILEYPELLGLTGLKIMVVIVAGSALVMAVTARAVCMAIRRFEAP